MKVEQRANGRVELVLLPEDDIERVFIKEMLTRASKGQAPKLSADADGGIVVSVER